MKLHATTKRRLLIALMTASALSMGEASTANAANLLVGLITPTSTNPYFVKMREGAEKEAAELGVTLQTFAGRSDSDNDSQVTAIETLVAAGAKAILIAAADPAAITTAVRKARSAGLLVIALDAPLDPTDAANMTFATDNFLAGELDGQWARGRLADKASSAKIALLDGLNPPTTVELSRDKGFLKGFGVDIKNPNVFADEDDPRIVGHAYAGGDEEGGRTAMERLLQENPNINVVYTNNEPVADGAFQAIRAAGKANSGILVVSVDGGCPGVESIAERHGGATAQQYPLKMASFGVEAAVEFAKTGKEPKASPGLHFFNTGTNLITDHPVAGVNSLDSKEGLALCWG